MKQHAGTGELWLLLALPHVRGGNRLHFVPRVPVKQRRRNAAPGFTRKLQRRVTWRIALLTCCCTPFLG